MSIFLYAFLVVMVPVGITLLIDIYDQHNRDKK
jgi:hypothetical protein